MKARRDRLARACAISEDLWRIEVMRLSQIEAKLSELADAERSALQALEHFSLDPSLLLRRLQTLTLRKAEMEAARQEQMTRTQAQGRRAKMTERLFERVQDAWRREEAAAELRTVSERSAIDKVRAP